jgi:hypothetical protein
LETQLLDRLWLDHHWIIYGASFGWSDRIPAGRLEGIPDFVDNNRGIPVDPMEQVMECQMAYSIKVQVGLLSVDDEGIATGKVGLWMEFSSRNHHRVCQWNG